MRAGAFCDLRVIDILNRRFVSYFYNRSGKGEGGNNHARGFVTGKTKNKYAFFAAFKADGTYLGETPLYGTKDEVFAFLLKLLADNPEQAKPQADEAAIRANAEKDPIALARLEESLGNFDAADPIYAAIKGSPNGTAALAARVRIARYKKDWTAHAALTTKLTNATDAAMERAYGFLEAKKYGEAQALLRKTLKAEAIGKRTGEMHFYCGVASWFLNQRAWAKFHWCWVQEHLPKDRMYMRCRIASAAEAMPYPNPALGGFKAGGNIGTRHIVAEVERSMRVYRKHTRRWKAGKF
jgi:hypothetical protein